MSLSKMKVIVLFLLAVAGAVSVAAQARVITEKEYKDANSTNFSRVLSAMSNRPTRIRKTGRKGIEGKPETESYAVITWEKSGRPNTPRRTTIEFRENGRTEKSTTVTVRKPGSAFAKDVIDHYGYDAATNRWYDVAAPRDPIEGFKYSTSPGEKVTEKVVSRTDEYKYLGTVTLNGRSVESYLHTHRRDFTVDGKAGHYESELKFHFAPDYSYFKSESSTLRKGPDFNSYSSSSEENEVTPVVTIEVPVSSGVAPNSMLIRLSSSSETLREWSDALKALQGGELGAYRSLAEFTFTRQDSPAPFLERKVESEVLAGETGRRHVYVKHTENGSTSQDEYWIARTPDYRSWAYYAKSATGQWSTLPSIPKSGAWTYSRLDAASIPKGTLRKSEYMFLGFEQMNGKVFRVFQSVTKTTYTVAGKQRVLTSSVKYRLSRTGDHLIQELTETISPSEGTVVQKGKVEFRAAGDFVIDIPKP